MSNFVLAMTPEDLSLIDAVTRRTAAIQQMLDDITARYNDMAREIWDLTLAGRVDFTEFHDPIRGLLSQLEVYNARRREILQQRINVALALPDLTNLNDGGCVFCLDVDAELEITGLSNGVCEMCLQE